MTEADVISHWRKGARDALDAAHLLQENKKFALALFNTHLAVEKALKARYMEELRKESPPTHNLVLLAGQLKHAWSDSEKRQLDYLTQYSVAARYDDPFWAEREATAENTAKCIAAAEQFLSVLLP